MNKIIALLQHILSATVADWTAENFEESKVKRGEGGKFASTGGGSSATKSTLKEIYNTNKQQLMDFTKSIRANCVCSEITLEPFAYDEYDRDRYISRVLVKTNKKNVDKVLKEVEKLNQNGLIAKAVTNDIEHGDKCIAIQIFNKDMINNYIDDASKIIQDTYFKDKLQEAQKAAKIFQANEPQSYRIEMEDDLGMLESMQNGRQYAHYLSFEGSTPLCYPEYIQTLKDQGITDKELSLVYLFTTNPTSIRLGGSDLDSVFEPEKKLCKELADTLESYIEKAPKWRGDELFRGCHIHEKDLKKMKPGKTMDMRGISSWSTDEKTAASFSYGGDEEEFRVVFHLENTEHGTSVATLSHFTNEEEVIVSGKSEFLISDVQSIDSIIHVYLEEQEW